MLQAISAILRRNFPIDLINSRQAFVLSNLSDFAPPGRQFNPILTSSRRFSFPAYHKPYVKLFLYPPIMCLRYHSIQRALTAPLIRPLEYVQHHLRY